MVSTLRIMLMSIGLLTLMSMVEASCPNRCSGHGSCGTSDVCACQQNWLGGDCSARQCAFTRAWSDTAQHENDAHYYAECGNRGTCDRTTGLCICDLGYTGSGCRRMTCPNDCSGHGTCEFIEELAIDDDKRVAGNTANTYAAWDTEKIVGCKCDPYYEGHDCSAKMCPKGDDPLTTGQSEMQQYLEIGHDTANGAGASFALTYYDPYGNAWTTDMIDAKLVTIGVGSPVSSDFSDTTHQDAICAKVQEKLRRLPNHAFDAVTVAAVVTASDATFSIDFTRTSDDASTVGAGTAAAQATPLVDSDSFQCLITFPTEPGTTGLQHKFKCHVGNRAAAGYFPSLADVVTESCYVGEYTGLAALTANVAVKLTEISDCSGRGTCDSSTGLCMCYSGHKGTACEKQEALV